MVRHVTQGQSYSFNPHISRGPLVPKITLEITPETLIFPQGPKARGKYEGFRSNFNSNFRSRAIWRYRSAINRTSARNTQSIFVLLSHRHQKCTLNGEITGLYFSWNVDKNSKNTSQFQLVARSLIHLLAYFSLWRIHGVQWMTFLWHFSYYLTLLYRALEAACVAYASLFCHYYITLHYFLMVQNILKIFSVGAMKTHVVCHLRMSEETRRQCDVTDIDRKSGFYGFKKKIKFMNFTEF